MTTITTDDVPHLTNWIDGDWHAAANGAHFERVNPFDGSLAGTFANSGVEDARRAVQSARRAFDSGVWSQASARTRYEILVRAAQLLLERRDVIAARTVLESGKPVTIALGEVTNAARCLDYYAGLGLASEGSAISERVPTAVGMILREPVGVAAMITPWNFPLMNVVAKVATALAAGCTVVIKPSHLCSGPAVLLGEILTEAGLPDGVCNVVTSELERGAVVGQYLSASHDVDKVAFTGSTVTGQAVMRAAASNTKRVSLELGGKSANIVFEDAPIELAARTAISAFCFQSGQQCSAGTRLLLQRSIHDQFVDLLADHAGQQVLGDPRDPATSMGPLVNEEQFNRVMGYIEVGATEGKLLTGGGRPTGPALASGWFVEPTIFDGVANSSQLAQEEIFGPVLAVIPFDTEDEAIALANDSRYGLAGGVWSNSISRALRVAKSVRTGKMFVNCYNSAGIDDMPHGGYKESGTGREFGIAGLEEYLELKTVQILL